MAKYLNLTPAAHGVSPLPKITYKCWLTVEPIHGNHTGRVLLTAYAEWGDEYIEIVLTEEEAKQLKDAL